MKKKEFEAIGNCLLPLLPGWAVKGQLLFMRPVGHTLRGICFNRSIDPRTFYVEVFFQPLFVPLEHIALNTGWRLRASASDSWNADNPNLIVELGAKFKREVSPFLSRIQTPRDVAEAASSIRKTTGSVEEVAISFASGDPINQQAIAFALARAGDVVEACYALERLTGLLDEEVIWQHKIADRARALGWQLRNDPAAAQKQLSIWENETSKNLGLEEFR